MDFMNDRVNQFIERRTLYDPWLLNGENDSYMSIANEIGCHTISRHQIAEEFCLHS
jgi:hypothetical protein